MMKPELWRDINYADRRVIVEGLFNKLVSRYEKGAQEHGDMFTDDPLDQAETELMDGLFYIEMARRERKALRNA